MKKTLLWVFAAILTLCGTSVFTSCSNDDQDEVKKPEPLVLTGEAAVEWTEAHLDSLVDVYMADCGHLLDPDATRAMLSKIGYTGLNVMDYKDASHVIDDEVFARLMERAIAADNKTILFTMGMYGCGKSASLRNNPELQQRASQMGVIYDGAYVDVSSFDKKVARSNAKGFTPSVIYVYNDAETAFTNCMERLTVTNRAIRYYTFITSFPSYQGRIEYFDEHYPDMEVHYLDNSHNSGGQEVSKEEAKMWDYTMDATMQNKLYMIMWNYINSGKLTDEQTQAVLKPES